MRTKPNEHANRVGQIREAMTGLVVLPAGRCIRRYTHGWWNKERTIYFVGYVWCRLHANRMTGMVYDATLGKGSDFDAALADAVRRENRKRAKLAGADDAR